MALQTMAILQVFGRTSIRPPDVPGLTTWITVQGAHESVEPNAAGVLERGLAQSPDASLITPAVREISALLRQFQIRLAQTKRDRPSGGRRTAKLTIRQHSRQQIFSE